MCESNNVLSVSKKKVHHVENTGRKNIFLHDDTFFLNYYLD